MLLIIWTWFRCYAWESSFQSKVLNVRSDELSWFRKASLLGAVWNQFNIFVPIIIFLQFVYLGCLEYIGFGLPKETNFCIACMCLEFFFVPVFNYLLNSFWQLNGFILNSIPVLVTVVSFGVFTFLGGDLTPARAFTSLSLFAVLRFPLFMLPNTITQVFALLFFFLFLWFRAGCLILYYCLSLLPSFFFK